MQDSIAGLPSLHETVIAELGSEIVHARDASEIDECPCFGAAGPSLGELFKIRA
jgi:hypothetical protein